MGRERETDRHTQTHTERLGGKDRGIDCEWDGVGTDGKNRKRNNFL